MLGYIFTRKKSMVNSQWLCLEWNTCILQTGNVAEAEYYVQKGNYAFYRAPKRT